MTCVNTQSRTRRRVVLTVPSNQQQAGPMRCFQRVARSAAHFRDRPAGAMRSALPDAVPTHHQHAYSRSQVSAPFDEAATCGSVSRVSTGEWVREVATYELQPRPLRICANGPSNAPEDQMEPIDCLGGDRTDPLVPHHRRPAPGNDRVGSPTRQPDGAGRPDLRTREVDRAHRRAIGDANCVAPAGRDRVDRVVFSAR